MPAKTSRSSRWDATGGLVVSDVAAIWAGAVATVGLVVLSENGEDLSQPVAGRCAPAICAGAKLRGAWRRLASDTRANPILDMSEIR
jgi:hypothetical protein